MLLVLVLATAGVYLYLQNNSPDSFAEESRTEDTDSRDILPVYPDGKTPSVNDSATQGGSTPATGSAPIPASTTSSSPSSTSSAGNTTAYTLEDIASHNSASDCWTAVNGKIYNITAYIPSHPGGEEIVRICGRDGSNMFAREREHQAGNARAILEQYMVGTLAL